jgi:hypothetical protein
LQAPALPEAEHDTEPARLDLHPKRLHVVSLLKERRAPVARVLVDHPAVVQSKAAVEAPTVEKIHLSHLSQCIAMDLKLSPRMSPSVPVIAAAVAGLQRASRTIKERPLPNDVLHETGP